MLLRRALLLAALLATPLAAQDGGRATGPAPDSSSVPYLPRPGLNDDTRWTYSAGDGDSVDVQTDWPGLRSEGRYLLGWSRWRPRQPRTLELNGRSVRYDNAVQLTRFDCAAGRSQVLRVVWFLNGSALDSADLAPEWHTHPHRPDDFDMRVLETACTPAAPNWPVPAALPEARWTTLIQNHGRYGGPAVAVDVHSRRRIGEHVYAWVRYIFPLVLTGEGVRYDRRYAIVRVDCAARRTQTLRNHYMLGSTLVRTDPRPWRWSDGRSASNANGRINAALCNR